MSKLRRVVSFILVLAMLATTSVFTLNVFAEDEKNPLASGIELTDEDLIIAEKLTTFGVINAVEESELANYLTRADVIGILMQYLGLGGNTFTATTSPFLDVSFNDPQIGAYSALYKAGYITGDENKMYLPNNLLTYNEAVTLVVNAMGYKVFAVRNGGYPAGYLYTANKYGILDGLRGNGNNPIPYCDLYRLIESSLEADAVVERVFTGDGEAEFALQKDVPVLEEIYNIKTIKGIVTGTEDTRLLSSNSDLISMYQVEIDGVIYDTDKKIFGDFIGRNVIAYAKKNADDDYEIIYLELADNKNTEFKIDAEDLLPNKTTASRIYYEDEESKERHIDVDSANLTVIYNGKAHSGYGALKNALPDSGYIVGLDNTGDEIVDVLFVYEFTNIVVGSIDMFNYAFYDKYTNEKYTFDPVKDDVRVYDPAGKYSAVDAIQADSLITITETSNDKGYKLINIYMCNKKAEGMIDEISADGKYLIGDTYYELAYNVENYVEEGELPPLKAGMNVVLYLDYEGNVGNYTLGNETSATYGFIAGVDEPDGGIATTLSMKIFTQDSTWVEAPTVDKLNIDGERYSVGTAAGMKAAVEKIPVGEVVLFRMQDNKISYIDTKEMNKGNFSKAADVGNLNLISEGEKFEQRNGMANEQGQLSLNKFVVKSGNCIIFSTPARGELLDDLEKYSVTTSLKKNYYTSSAGTYNQVMTDGYMAFNIGDEDINVATCLLLRGSESAGASDLGRTSPYVVVTKVSSALNEDGESRPKVYYTSGGAENGLVVAEKVKYSYALGSKATPVETPFADIGLEVGDVIQIGTDAEGYLSIINVVYRHDQEAGKNAYLTNNVYNLSFGGNEGEGAACGKVVKVDPTNKILQFGIEQEDGSMKTYNISTSGASCSIYRHELEKAEVADLAALMEGDIVLVRTSTGFAASAAQILVLR
ncbi:MAG: hypothetical protein IJC78_05975 [Clostridia bacterium]|nr:hypothetical protein [Clostridia bacterium]